jgi:O-antigen/teichoic acid export membrane protein
MASDRHNLFKGAASAVSATTEDRSLRRFVFLIMQGTMARTGIILANILAGLLTAKMLGTVGKGEQAAIILWPQLVSSFFALGLASATTYLHRNEDERFSEDFGAILVLGFVLGLGATATGALLIPQLMGHYPARTIETAQWLMLFGPSCVTAPCLLALLEAKGRFALSNGFMLIQPTAAFVVIVSLALMGVEDPIAYGLAYMLPSIPVFIAQVGIACHLVRPRLSHFRSAVARAVHYGSRAYGMDVVTALSNQIDLLLVVMLFPPEALGIYTVANSIARCLYIVQSSATAVLLPGIVARTEAVVIAMVGHTLRLANVVMPAIAIALGIVAHPLIVTVYGEAFSGAASLLLIFLVEVVVTTNARVLSQAFLARNRPGMISLANLLWFAVTAAGAFAVGDRFGVAALAFVTLGASVVRLIAIASAFPLILKASIPVPILCVQDVKRLWIMARSRVAEVGRP